eukprot:1157035-Pelagomonas_calceolata.AAC.7
MMLQHAAIVPLFSTLTSWAIAGAVREHFKHFRRLLHHSHDKMVYFSVTKSSLPVQATHKQFILANCTSES